MDSKSRTIWIADARRGDGKRFVVRAAEILTAFLQLRSGDSRWKLRAASSAWAESRL